MTLLADKGEAIAAHSTLGLLLEAKAGVTEVRAVSGDHMRMYAALTVAKDTSTTSHIVAFVTYLSRAALCL